MKFRSIELLGSPSPCLHHSELAGPSSPFAVSLFIVLILNTPCQPSLPQIQPRRLSFYHYPWSYRKKTVDVYTWIQPSQQECHFTPSIFPSPTTQVIYPVSAVVFLWTSASTSITALFSICGMLLLSRKQLHAQSLLPVHFNCIYATPVPFVGIPSDSSLTKPPRFRVWLCIHRSGGPWQSYLPPRALGVFINCSSYSRSVTHTRIFAVLKFVRRKRSPLSDPSVNLFIPESRAVKPYGSSRNLTRSSYKLHHS